MRSLGGFHSVMLRAVGATSNSIGPPWSCGREIEPICALTKIKNKGRGNYKGISNGETGNNVMLIPAISRAVMMGPT